ncbi:hypothetical protein AB0I60_04860 [Actinosynnema sp. NPDC050436]|uniref:hypothetical protein n=1 Tax=Actinosynnema sp. NPDC050436 TaxID=3155659 RepID=UPI0033EE112B
MSVLPAPLAITPRTSCGATPLVQIGTFTIAAAFVVVLVLLGQPLTGAAGVAAWLITTAVRSTTNKQAGPARDGAAR